MENNAETRRRLSIPHANILSSASAMYADRGHRDACYAKLENLKEWLEKADAEQKELLAALKLAKQGLECAIENAKAKGDDAFMGYALTLDKIHLAIAKAEGR